MSDPGMLSDYVAHLDDDPTGNSRFFWRYLESEMGIERAMSKYMALVGGAIFTSDLEVERGVDNSNRFFNVSYVARPLSSVADSTVTVTDAQLREYYDSHKRIFKQGESRELQYVVFEALPSEADYKEAEKNVNEIAEQLRDTEDPMQYAKLNGGTDRSAVFMTADELDPALAPFGRKAVVGDIYGPEFANDKYTVARMVARRSMPDSIGFMQIVLAADKTALADSLVRVLKRGGDFEALAMQFSLDNQSDMGRINPAMIVAPGFESYAEALSNSRRGDVFKVTTPYGIAVIKNTYRGKIVP
ncbi:MAG: peptidylprolyl isomerase, partial [Rikenellaceae bacterium]|nr:peptidylprolyl isomerase [Rikenellaceae bacterium]